MVGELTYFLGLQVKRSDEGIFISQSKYAMNLVKKFGLENLMVRLLILILHYVWCTQD